MLRPGILLALVSLTGCVAAAPAYAADLERHTVTADGHPLAVWEKRAADASEAILLVHGRTWSCLLYTSDAADD